MTQQRNDSDSIEMKILLREVKRSLTAGRRSLGFINQVGFFLGGGGGGGISAKLF